MFRKEISFGFCLIALSLAAFAAEYRVQAISLSFNDRVEYQRAIEQVYYAHRLWPEHNGRLKPSLNSLLSESILKGRVKHYLDQSRVWEARHGHLLSNVDLQAEVNRISHDTKAPAVLAELFAALHNDPYLINECLARPTLVNRVEAAPSAGTPPSKRDGHTAVWTGSEMIVWGGFGGPDAYTNTGGRYNPTTDSWTATHTTKAPTARTTHVAVWTGKYMLIWGGNGNLSTGAGTVFNTGGRYNPETDSWKLRKH